MGKYQVEGASESGICEECGNDEATEGYRLCSECLESGVWDE